MKKSFLSIMLVLAALLVTLVAGCSSSDGGSNTTEPVVTGDAGSIQIAIAWPTDGARVIPAGTKSIKVTITETNSNGSPKTGAYIRTLFANQGVSGTLDFNIVPVGYYTIAGSAWDAFGGIGNVLGSASAKKVNVTIGRNHVFLVLSDQMISLQVTGPSNMPLNSDFNSEVRVFFGTDSVSYPLDQSRCTWTMYANGTNATIDTGYVDAGGVAGTGVYYNAETQQVGYPQVNRNCQPFAIN